MGPRAYRVAVLGCGLLAVGLLVADPVARILLHRDPPAVLERVSWSVSAPADPGLDGPQGPVGPSAGRSGTGALDTEDLGPVLRRGPEVVKSSYPPSVRLVPPRAEPVDNGIGDTGVHSEGQVLHCDCPEKYRPGTQTSVSAVPGPTGVAVSWRYTGDPAVVQFWVGYQPQTWVPEPGDPTTQTRPQIVWVPVARPAAAGTVTWTLPGPQPGTGYTFYLEVEAKTPELSQPEDPTRTTRFQLGRRTVTVP